MKTVLLFLTFWTLQASAANLKASSAQIHPTLRFVNSFVQAVNDRLETLNEERAMSGTRLYCAQLSEEQVQDLENLFVINVEEKSKAPQYRQLAKITVNQFISAASDNLGCYPTFWPGKGRSTIGGVLLNSKAFVMDHLLLREALNDFAGRRVDDNELLSQLFPR